MVEKGSQPGLETGIQQRGGNERAAGDGLWYPLEAYMEEETVGEESASGVLSQHWGDS